MLEMLSFLVLLWGYSSLALTDFIVTGQEKEQHRNALCPLKIVLKENVLCEKECHCVNRNFEDPRNECVTTGSFPACVMWVRYICDLLGYSQCLGNMCRKPLIYTLHHCRSNTDNCTISLWIPTMFVSLAIQTILFKSQFVPVNTWWVSKIGVLNV
jgi:hypothetical protein